MTGFTRALAVVAMMLLATACGGVSATPSPSRPGPNLGTTEGCAPAFWSQPANFHHWEEHEPDQVVGLFFPEPARYAQFTLVEALRFADDGDSRLMLLREAVAAILNGAHESIDYPYSRYEVGVDGRPPIVPTTNELLNAGSESHVTTFALQLAEANRLGCPWKLDPTPT
jgi:hypothetical protein